MPPNHRYIYWDSCVFLAYINGEAGRKEVIDKLWQEISDTQEARIITSAITPIEVAHAEWERTRNRLDPYAAAAIDAIWNNDTVMQVEVAPFLVKNAVRLIRDSIPNRWVLRPLDALQLATAAWVNANIHPISEVNTYDDKWPKFQAMIGIQIREPYVEQLALPGVNETQEQLADAATDPP